MENNGKPIYQISFELENTSTGPVSQFFSSYPEAVNFLHNGEAKKFLEQFCSICGDNFLANHPLKFAYIKKYSSETVMKIEAPHCFEWTEFYSQ
jgi:hypothetical protein